ncbi:MAG: alpha/beta fold hydrolase [Cytophagales bacterium]|nr:alpha/beta fold hydrolase [Cytophagales bacterium]
MSASKGTLLFVHGMCHGSWCWHDAFIPFFESKGYQCLAIELEGHQEGNEESIRHVRLSDFDRNIKEAVKAIKEPPIIIGHSMGGMAVQRYLRKGTCKKAVLLATVPAKGALAASLRVIKKHPGSIKYLLKGDLLGFTRAYDQLFFGTEISDKKRSTYRKKLCAESFIAYLQLLFPLGKSNYSGPMLVIGGEEDEIFTTREMAQTAKKYGADLDIIAGGAHDLMIDTQKQEVAKIIHRWMHQ